MKIRERYKINKDAKVGDKLNCPSPNCDIAFVKEHYAQAFCKSKGGTKCKDKYWNTVTPKKRNNLTRISPASARWSREQEKKRERNYDPHDDEHPFSSEALGQW